MYRPAYQLYMLHDKLDKMSTLLKQQAFLQPNIPATARHTKVHQNSIITCTQYVLHCKGQAEQILNTNLRMTAIAAVQG